MGLAVRNVPADHALASLKRACAAGSWPVVGSVGVDIQVQAEGERVQAEPHVLGEDFGDSAIPGCSLA